MMLYIYRCCVWNKGNPMQARTEGSNGCPLPHCCRQVGAYWHLPPPSNAYSKSHCCRTPAGPSQVPHWDVGDMAEESRASPYLVCHHWGCGVSRGRPAWERTQAKIPTWNVITTIYWLIWQRLYTVYFKTFKVILRNFLCSLEITNPIEMMDNTIIKSDCTWGDVIVLIQA